MEKSIKEKEQWKNEILCGITALPPVGTPGTIVVYGENAAPLLTGTKNTDLICAAAEYEKGRVIVIPHGGYASDKLDKEELKMFKANCVKWLSRGENTPKVYSWDKDAKSPAKMAAKEVIIANGGSKIPETYAVELLQFITKGGGVLLATCPWGCLQLNRDKPLNKWGINNILEAIGVAFTDKYAANCGGFKCDDFERLMRECNLHYALQNCLVDDDFARRNVGTVAAALKSLPEPHQSKLRGRAKSLMGSQKSKVKLPAKTNKLVDSYDIGLLNLFLVTLEECDEAPGIENFPGVVPKGCPCVTVEVDIHSALADTFPAGCWAPAGKTLTLISDLDFKGWTVRIGAHTDCLDNKKELRRLPNICYKVPIDKTEMTFSSPFGGAVYFDSPRRKSNVRFTVTGGVEQPHFDITAEDNKAWKHRMECGSPWADLTGKFISFSVPTYSVEKLDDPTEILQTWDRIIVMGYHLAGVDPCAQRRRYIVPDEQPSAGYMHAGYPIVTHLDVVDPKREGFLFNIEHLTKSGTWGMFHELGHNLQKPEWTGKDQGEVTVNWFSLYCMETLCGFLPLDTKWINGQKGCIKKALETSDPFQILTSNPCVYIGVFAQLAHHLGWEHYKRVIKEYQSMAKADQPKTDQAKRDEFLTKFQNQCKMCLLPLFDFWCIPISDPVRKTLQGSGFPQYLPNDWITEMAPDRVQMVIGEYPNLIREATRTPEVTQYSYPSPGQCNEEHRVKIVVQ